MTTVGLTGGIGSGKSTVARVFQTLGVPVYNSDDRAKLLMDSDVALRSSITDLLGNQAYADGRLNRAHVAALVFNDDELREQLNTLVHPAVAKDFKTWAANQSSNYVIKEAAILFETGGYSELDQMILVTAPKDVRIERVMARDHSTKAQVLSRMDAQWPDERKIPLSDHVLVNDGRSLLLPQIVDLHEQLNAL